MCPMRPKDPPMKTKLAMLLALAALVVGGNARADMVLGIKNTSSSASASNLTNILSFNTTALGGAKVSGIGLFTDVIFTTQTGTVTFKSSGGISEDQTASFQLSNVNNDLSGNAVNLSWGSGSSGYLLASRTYTLDLAFAGATVDQFTKGGTYSVESGISNYWASPTAGATGSVAVQIYYDTTSVPEPGTMILTGTALAAGAVGAYFKRRRKAKAEVAA
jgi:hypothetical protein